MKSFYFQKVMHTGDKLYCKDNECGPVIKWRIKMTIKGFLSEWHFWSLKGPFVKVI